MIGWGSEGKGLGSPCFLGTFFAQEVVAISCLHIVPEVCKTYCMKKMAVGVCVRERACVHVCVLARKVG